MNNKLKSFLAASVIVASIAAMPLFSSANKEDGKVTLCHNGHSITISSNAVQKHLDNHNKAGAKLTCFIVTAARPCTGVITGPCGCTD